MNRPNILRCLALPLLAACLFSDPMGAVAEPPAAPPTRFWIETITIEEPHRVSREILLSEARLEVSREYTEADLRQAIHRIRRLPFILDADFALRRGSGRGKYALVITLVETRRFFFGTDANLLRLAEPLRLENGIPAENDERITFTAGMRFFVGPRGVAFLSVGDGVGVQGGYTQYDLFGAGSFLNVGLAWNVCCSNRIFSLGLDPTFANWELDDSREVSVTAGLPLRGSQSLEFSVEVLDTNDQFGDRRPVRGMPRLTGTTQFQDLEITRLGGRWLRDERDDALFPTQGDLLSVGISYTALQAPMDVLDFREDPFGVERIPVGEYSARWLELRGDASRYWSVSPRQTLSAGAGVGFGFSRVENVPIDAGTVFSDDLTSLSGTLGAGYSLRLLGSPETVRRWGDLRFELSGEYAYEQVFPDAAFLDNPLERIDLGAALSLRNRWGLFRLRLSFVDVGEILR
jgi:hypothetical protein